MLLVVTIWAGNNVLTKAAVDQQISPLVYVFLRFAIVSALLFSWLKLRHQIVRIRREDYGRLLLTGVSGYAAYNLLFVVGLSRTSAFSAAILVGMAPVFSLLIASALKIEKVTAIQWIGVTLAFSGVALFVIDKLASGSPAIGDLLNLIAALSFAIYGLSTRCVVQRYGSPTVTAWSVTIALIVVLPVTLPAVAREDWSRLGLLAWGSVFYAAVFSMLIAYTLWGWAIGRAGAGRTVPFLFLIPVLTGLLAFGFLDDQIGPVQLIGATLALLGVFLARRVNVLADEHKVPSIANREFSDLPAVAKRDPVAGP
jgi:drug/metabolite transporter (DMT)-like permease